MPRIAYIGAAAILLGLAALIALEFVNSPVAAKREALAYRLENTNVGGAVAQIQDDVDYESIRYAVTAKPNLWEPLTKPPKAKPKPPNLAEVLNGVSISRSTVGSGLERKIKVTMPEWPNGQWVGVGDKVRGLTIKRISRRAAVTFVQNFQGREYAFTLTQ